MMLRSEAGCFDAQSVHLVHSFVVTWCFLPLACITARHSYILTFPLFAPDLYGMRSMHYFVEPPPIQVITVRPRVHGSFCALLFQTHGGIICILCSLLETCEHRR
jgi:hypothetical protein